MSPYASFDEWIAGEAISFSFDRNFDAAVDRMMSALGDAFALLGIGEPLHGGDEFLTLRNRFFQRLVEAHGFCAIAVESSYPRGLAVEAYIAGRGAQSYDAVEDTGFSHNFGRLAANRELVEWMRRYNSDPAHSTKLRFYGIDAPTESYMTESPRQVLEFALSYLASVDAAAGARHGDIIQPLLGTDAAWEDPAAIMDRTKAIGLSPEASALRLATENLATELRMRRPELVGKSDRESFLEALHHLSLARQLLTYHAALAAGEPIGIFLGMRDAMMAENLVRIAAREEGRGNVLVFAHNSHLKRSEAVWPWYGFWPAGSQLDDIFGARYAVIGAGLGVSDVNGIGEPEAGSLEARLLAMQADSFVATRRGRMLEAEIAAFPVRSAGTRNRSYQPLSPQSLADFDGFVFLRAATYTRGAQPLPE